MFKIKTLTLKNFLSIGNVTQSINFVDRGLSLILGENLDMGGAGCRNGVGKTTILQALTYGFYDGTITPIRKDNLINMTNGRNMLVTIEFEIDGINYRIERGRRPNVFRFFVGDQLINEAQGENRHTNADVRQIIGMSIEMFKHIVVLNTYTQPFLLMKQNDQRMVIEELLGITVLSEKAEKLKKLIKDAKDTIKEEEYRIKATLESNETITNTIRTLQGKSKLYQIGKDKNIIEFNDAIDALGHLDIKAEIKAHKRLSKYNDTNEKKQNLARHYQVAERAVLQLAADIESTEKQISKVQNHKCPTCGNDVHDENHRRLSKSLEADKQRFLDKLDAVEKDFVEYKTKLLDIPTKFEEFENVPTVFYPNIDEAYNHKQSLNSLKIQLKEELKKVDAFLDQITTLEDEGIKDLSYVKLNKLKNLHDHQEFLYKLLVRKDSGIRMRLIDQNLPYLNSRLTYYLTKLGLPHQCEFKNDLSIEIIQFGQNFDFGQLSRGQQNRLILALSWAFRDVWESTGHHINILFIDEMIDSGIDTQGVENTLEVLKKMTRERGKDIFLISHKEELINRVHNVMMVTFENGFTTFEVDDDTENMIGV